MFCKNCGTQVPEGTRFCPSCGCSLTEDSVADRGASPRPTVQKPGRPTTYLALSIIITILCCLPFGIVGIVYASKTDSCYSKGFIDDAWTNSRKARNWCIAGLVAGLIWWIVYAVLIFIVGVAWLPFSQDIMYTDCLL